PLVVIEAPDVAHRDRLRRQHQRREFLGKEKVVNIAEQRFPDGLVERLVMEQQVELWLWSRHIPLCLAIAHIFLESPRLPARGISNKPDRPVIPLDARSGFGGSPENPQRAPAGSILAIV